MRLGICIPSKARDMPKIDRGSSPEQWQTKNTMIRTYCGWILDSLICELKHQLRFSCGCV